MVEMAPGAGKIFTIEAIAMLFEQAKPNVALMITEQNVNMVTEVEHRLRVAMPGVLIVRVGYNHATQEDGWTVAWEEVVNKEQEAELKTVEIVGRYSESQRQIAFP